MKDYLLRRPMLLCAVLAVVISVLGFELKGALTIILLLLILTLALFLFKLNIKALIINIILIALVICQITEYSNANKINESASEKTEAKFVVYDLREVSNGYRVADVEIIESDILDKGTRVSVIYSALNLDLGDIAEAKLYLNSIDNEYRTYNLSKGIYINAAMYECTSVRKKGDFVLGCVGKIRKYISDTVYSNLDYETASTVKALILGDKSGLTDDFSNCIRRSGVSHLMVVSGMHLAIFVSVLTTLFNRLINNRFLKALLIMSAILTVASLCGFTMSVLRAGFMYLLVGIGLILNRDTNSENILGATVSIILFFSPLAFLNLGFQLSVLSTFGILSVALPVIKYLKEKIESPVTINILSVLLITLSATLLTLPVIIYNYGEASAVSVFTNLIVTSFINPIFWLALIGLMLNLISPFLARLLFSVCSPLVEFVNNIITLFGGMKYSAVKVSKEYSVIIAFIIFIIFCLLLACKKRDDMIKLEKLDEKILSEGGKRLKWQ